MTKSGISYVSLTDDDLLYHLKNDDHLAFTEIFDRYSNILYGHAYNKLRNKNDAKDVVQEMFIKIWNQRQNLEQRSNLLPYLFRMLRNLILNLIRHKKFVNSYAFQLSTSNEDSGIYTDTLVRERQFAAMIEAEINNLPPRMRAVFELRRKENFSNKEVAAQLGITESTAADQMKKALRILKAKIGLLIIFAYYLNIK